MEDFFHHFYSAQCLRNALPILFRDLAQCLCAMPLCNALCAMLFVLGSLDVGEPDVNFVQCLCNACAMQHPWAVVLRQRGQRWRSRWRSCWRRSRWHRHCWSCCHYCSPQSCQFPCAMPLCNAPVQCTLFHVVQSKTAQCK